MALPQITLNSKRQAWGSISAEIDGLPTIRNFTEISYGHRVNAEPELGTGRVATNWQPGVYETDPSKLKGFKANVGELKAALALKAGDKSISDVFFTMTIKFKPQDTDPPSVVVLHGCRLLESTNSHAAGPDNLQTEVSIKPTWIEEDGLTLLPLSEILGG